MTALTRCSPDRSPCGDRIDESKGTLIAGRKTGPENFETACGGQEGLPKGRRFYRYCANAFRIQVSIGYKNAGR